MRTVLNTVNEMSSGVTISNSAGMHTLCEQIGLQKTGETAGGLLSVYIIPRITPYRQSQDNILIPNVDTVEHKYFREAFYRIRLTPQYVDYLENGGTMYKLAKHLMLQDT
jgi:hypothetical protein